MPETLNMTRDAEAFPDSHDAVIDPSKREAWEAAGWSLADPLDHDGDGARGGSQALTDDEKAAKAALIDEIVALGGEKPHHATGLPRLAEIKAELVAKAETDAAAAQTGAA